MRGVATQEATGARKRLLEAPRKAFVPPNQPKPPTTPLTGRKRQFERARARRTNYGIKGHQGRPAMDHAAEVARDRELIQRSRARIALTDDLVADSVGCLAESQRLLRALWARAILAEPPKPPHS
jgi:hypothetical protein